MSTLFVRGQFNGAVLVVGKGEIIYRKAFGKANFQMGADFTPDTPSNIGSVTKQFTAMAIMILAERSKLAMTTRLEIRPGIFLHSAFQQNYSEAIIDPHVWNP